MVTKPEDGGVLLLKRTAREVKRAREELSAVLAEIERRQAAQADAECSRAEAQAADATCIRDLQRDLEDAKGQLEAARSETEAARRELSRLRSDVQRATQQGIIDIYKAIGRRSPYQQIEDLRKTGREAHGLNNQLQARVTELSESLTQCTGDLHGREAEVERQSGLINRYKETMSRQDEQLRVTERESRHETLRNLVRGLTPRRLAKLMTAPDQSTPIDPDADGVSANLVEYLRTIGLRVTYSQDEQVLVGETDLHLFRLDEEFRQGSTYLVTAPGFALGDEVLIKARIRYMVKEVTDGPNNDGDERVSGEMPGGPEGPGRGREEDMAHSKGNRAPTQ